MKPCNHFYLLLMTALLFVTGCSNNMRIFKKSSLTARAALSGDTASYYHLRFGHPASPLYQDATDFRAILLDFGEDGIQAIGGLSADKLIQHCDNKVIVQDMGGGSIWPDDAICLSFQRGIDIYVREGDVLQVRLTSAQDPAMGPRVGRRGELGNEIFYEMPLTDEQMTELFGAPDSVFDKFVQ